MEHAWSFGWHRQSQLGDGDLPAHRTIAKAFGLDAATRLMPAMRSYLGPCNCPRVISVFACRITWRDVQW